MNLVQAADCCARRQDNLPGAAGQQTGQDVCRENERTLNPALHGCETFDFAPSDLAALYRALQRYPAFSVHAPLPTLPEYPGSPATSYLLDPDPEKRRASLHMLEHTVRLASLWGAKYIVVHFGGLGSGPLDRSEVLALAKGCAIQLDAWGRAYDIPLHIEYAAYNPSLATPEDLLALVEAREYLDVCLDVGHLRVSAHMLGRDEFEMAELLAPRTRSMHLWTLRDREDVARYHHVPVHPLLTPAEGWIDIPALLELVFSRSGDCAVVFEPHHAFNPDLDWQAEGMTWVRNMVRRLRRGTAGER